MGGDARVPLDQKMKVNRVIVGGDAGYRPPQDGRKA